MTTLHDVRIRVVLAFAIGVGIVLLEAWAYGFQHWSPIGISIVWLKMLIAFLGSFALAFKWRPLRGERPAPEAWLADLDSSGLLIPLVMLVGVTVTETVGLIRDTMIDPTTLPFNYVALAFQYFNKWLVLGLPALAGSMLARAMSWAVNRVRVQ